MGARALLRLAAALAPALAAADGRPPASGRAVEAGGPRPSASGTPRPEGAPVRWRAGRGLEELARTLSRDSALFARFPGIGDLGELFRDSITVYLVRDLDTLSAPGSVVREEWVAGFADYERRVVGVRADQVEGGVGSIRPVLRHELAHLALSRVTRGRAPRWVQEGYAQLASGSWDSGQAWRLRFFFLRAGGGTLDRLTVRFPRERQPARMAYLLSYTAVQELYRRGGEYGLGRFFEELGRGASVDRALRDVYGVTLIQFEEQWRESVSDRYGWLYLISRATFFWTLVAVAVLVVWWIRRRRNRERMEELRREERREAIRRLLDGERPDGGPDPGRAPGGWDPPDPEDDWRGR